MKRNAEHDVEPAAVPSDNSARSNSCVSVILPVHNRFKFLPQAINSVLNQTYPNIQLIVVDDGSKLDLEQLVVALGSAAEFYRKTHGGPASARNFGMARAKGDFLLFLDDDDFLEATAVASLLDAINANPACAWSAGRLAYVDENGRRLPLAHPCSVRSGDVYLEMIQNNLIGTPSAVLLRTRVLRALGGFDENPLYQFCEDYDLWLTLARDYPIIAVPQVVSNYRYHAENATRHWARHYHAWLAIMEKHRLKARAGLGTAFEAAIGQVHLNFGDELYVHGRHSEARRHWTQAYKANPQLGRGRKCVRFAKSYLPAAVLKVFRKVQSRIL